MSEAATLPAFALPTHGVHLPRQSSEPSDKRLRVKGKTRDAILRMIELGEEMDVAAQAVGTSTRTIREAFQRPHVQAFVKEQRDVFRARICAGNIHRLATIRDAADNQPAVNAIKVLEQLSENDAPGRSGPAESAGLTIQILNVQQVDAPHADKSST